MISNEHNDDAFLYEAEHGQIEEPIETPDKIPNWLTEQIQGLIDEIKSDDRYLYPNANVMVNAPLAIIQIGFKSKVAAFEQVLSLRREK